jgi:hypothetical protein
MKLKRPVHDTVNLTNHGDFPPIGLQFLSQILVLLLVISSIGKAQQRTAEQPTTAPAAGADLTQTQLMEELKKLGAVVKTDGGVPDGAVVEITFVYTHKPRMSAGGAKVPPYQVTDDLVRQIAKLPKLASLELNMCPNLTEAAIKDVGRMTQLEHLALPGPRMTDAGMADLAGLGPAPKTGG